MQLSHKLDVAEKLVLSPQGLLRDLCFVNLLAGSLSLFPEVLLLEEGLEARLAMGQQLTPEFTVLDLCRQSLAALGGELDPDDLYAELAVEVRVGVLGLGLAEDSLHDNIQLGRVNFEACALLSVIACLVHEFSVTNQHDSELGQLLREVVRCDKVEAEPDLL